MTTMTPVNDFLHACSRRIEKNLNLYFRRYSDDNLLMEAVIYATLDGGKRIRPALTYACAELVGMPTESADDVACAIELIHSYSLIHDDLPAMDDDDLRRGKPTTHKAFGEALAILAGDAIHATTFEMLAKSEHLDAEQKVTAISLLAGASGIDGMSHGQTLDLVKSADECDLATLETIHRLKTGALMETCILIPLNCRANLTAHEQNELRAYAQDIGLCFQICDDILDVETDQQTTNNQQQATYPSLLGIDEAKRILTETCDNCLKRLDVFGERAAHLKALTVYIAERTS